MLCLNVHCVLQDGAPDYMDEIRQLEAEGDMPIDQLLSSLPPEILEGRPMTPTSSQEEGEEEGVKEQVDAEASGVSVSGKAPATRKEVAVKERRTRCVAHKSNACSSLPMCNGYMSSLSLSVPASASCESRQRRVVKVSRLELVVWPRLRWVWPRLRWA